MRRNAYITGAAAVVLGAGIGVWGVLPVGDATAEAESVARAYLLAPVQAQVPEIEEEAPAPETPQFEVVSTEIGSASFYANSLAGRRTASGVPYNPREMVAAHRTLPFGSLLRVTNEANGKTVKVRVVDRGPFARGRVLDLSRIAAEELGFIRQGHTRVTIEVLEDADPAEDA